MKAIVPFLLILTILVSITCKKNLNGPYIPPHALFFQIKKAGARLPDSVLDNIKMYYYTNNTKKYVIDFSSATDTLYSLGVLGTRDIGLFSGDQNIKDYYLEFLNGDIDTLFVDYRHLSEREASQHSCFCYYPLEIVRFNGQNVVIDPAITFQPTYVFVKP